MRVTVRRTGGFAGVTRTWEVDTATLPAARAAEIERLANELAAGSSQQAVADAFVYEVIIDGKTMAVEDAGPLIEKLHPNIPTS
jgi:hypothetical protein